MGLVEVVEVEHQAPFRGGEHPEIAQVGVPAQLGIERGPGSAGQVGGHQQRRAAIEGELRHQHPSIPDRHQIRHPVGGLAVQQVDRIVGRVHQLGVRLERNCLPHGFSGC
jgi:hypothetical protein